MQRRIDEMQSLGSGLSHLGGWFNFTGHAFVNVLRSKGARI